MMTSKKTWWSRVRAWWKGSTDGPIATTFDSRFGGRLDGSVFPEGPKLTEHISRAVVEDTWEQREKEMRGW